MAVELKPRRGVHGDRDDPRRRAAERRAHQLTVLDNQKDSRARDARCADNADRDAERSLVQRNDGLEERSIERARSASTDDKLSGGS